MTTQEQDSIEQGGIEQAFRAACAARSFAGALVFADDAGYEEARLIWNAAIDRQPAVIAQCTGAADVQAALAAAIEFELPIAVRGGGHSYAGHSTCNGGVIIDLGPMRTISIDPEQRLATVEPGLTWGDVVDATQEHGLVAVGGHVSVVGVPGLLLGGGISWLARSHGLACDQLVAAQVVTADGDIVEASATEHPDLFWALRGGGGNFGIVTRFTLRLHPLTSLFAGMAIYPGERTHEVLRFFRDFGAEAPDALNVMAGLVTAPPAPFIPEELQGRPAVLLAAAYIGPVEEGERALAPLRELGPPAVDLFGPMPYGQLQRLFDGMGSARTAVHMRSELLGQLDGTALDTLEAHAASIPPGLSNILIIPLGGAVAAIPADATAFPHRTAHYNIEIGAGWMSPDEDTEAYRAWADACWEAMRPWSAGAEINHMGDEGPARVREAYGEATYARLAEIKRAYDPENRFRLNQNIELAG